jgi:putative oxidoreductase
MDGLGGSRLALRESAMNKVALRTMGIFVLRIAVGAIFFYAGVVKLRDPRAFSASIASFQLLPVAWIPVLASSLPFFEAIAGFWLIIGWRPRAASFVALLLSAVFVVAIGQAKARGLHVTCGCFGDTLPETPWITLARDLFLVAAAGLVFGDGWRRDDRIL